MMILFLAGVLLAWSAEAAGNPIHQALGVNAADGNLEGKEVRFGIFRLSTVRDHYDGCILRRRQCHARLVHGPGWVCATL